MKPLDHDLSILAHIVSCEQIEQTIARWGLMTNAQIFVRKQSTKAFIKH